MRREFLATVLCAFLMGLGALAATGSESGTDPGRELVSIHVRDGDVQDVVQTLVTASGASIVVGDVTGHITLDVDNVPMERVLEIICTAKGLHWWRDGDGLYFVSAQPRPASSGEISGLPGVTESDKQPMISRMYRLQFMPPQYVAWLFGTSENPGPLPYDPDVLLVLMSGGRRSFSTSGGPGELAAGGRGGGGGGGGGGGFGGGAGGGGGAFTGGAGGGLVGGGAFSEFLPEGIEAMIAFPVLNSLLIRGTEEDINELIEILRFVDHKPQQIIVELQSVQVSTSLQKEMGVDWYYIAGGLSINTSDLTTDYNVIVEYERAGLPNFGATLTYLLETGRGRIVDAIRVSTMNLMPAINQVTVNYPWVTVGGIAGDPFRGTNIQTTTVTTYSIVTSLIITPRINGDGTITMYIPFQKSTITGSILVPISPFDTVSYPITTVNNLTTTVNVRDGETFVIGGFINKDELETNTKLPLLGDIPILGDLLFTRKFRTINETETLLFITPRIVKEEAAPATLGPI